jgi:hypothetical protein
MLGIIVVFDVVFDFGLQVAKVTLNCYYVLLGAFSFEKVGVWLNPIGRMYNRDGMAVEEILGSS